MNHWTLDILDIAYHDEGEMAAPVALLHGWPDDPSRLEVVAGHLRPWPRRFGPARFHSDITPRNGGGVAPGLGYSPQPRAGPPGCVRTEPRRLRACPARGLIQ